MTTRELHAAPPIGCPRAATVSLWTAQGMLSLFFLVAASCPKLRGGMYSVPCFEDIC